MKKTLAVLMSFPIAAMAASELVPNTLPTGYRQVEYVSFPLGAYVNTGLKLTDVQITTKFEVPPTYYSNMSVFGTAYGGSAIHLTQYNNAWYWGTYNREANSSGVCAWKSGVHELVYAERGTGKVRLDGQVIGSDAAHNGTMNNILHIGARGETDANRTFVGRIYSFAVTNLADGAAVMDLVPALRESDSLAGFYDRVSGAFLSSGAGRLNAARTHLEYERLAGVFVPKGTCFDTGLVVTNCQITMDYKKDAYESNCHMLGTSAGAQYTQLTELGYRYYVGGYDTSTKKAVERSSERYEPWTTGRHHVVYSQNGTSTGDVVVDGKVVVTDTVGHNTAGRSLLLFTRQWASSSTSHNYSEHPSQDARFEGEVYSLAVTNRDGVALMELVPCRRKATGEVGFYDLVRSVFITALGDGVPRAAEGAPAYEEVPYLAFTEGAYINLGYAVKGVQITMKCDTPYLLNRHLFGQAYSAGYLSMTEYSHKWYWGAKGSETNGGKIDDAVTCHEIVYSKIGSGDVVVNGTVVGTASTENTTQGYNLLIGSRSSQHNFVGDIYYFSVTNHDGTAVADLVPRRRLADNAVGFYDRVSGKFYTNAGTAGTITVPMPTALYEPAAFVEFPVMGGYLDTGVAVQTNNEVTVKFEMDYLNNRHVIGQEISSSFCHFTACANKWYWGRGANGGEGNSGSVAWSGGVHTLVYQKKVTSDVVLDGTVLGQAVGAHTYDRPLLIGSRAGEDNFVGKIYSLAVTNNATGACVLDLRPCVRKADGKCGFYDMRSGRFLTSSLVGYRQGASESEPAPDIRTMYYLKANGAYVDTRLFANDGLRIKADVREDNLATGQVLYGACGYGYDCCCSNSTSKSVFLAMGKGSGHSAPLASSRYAVDVSLARGAVNDTALFENAEASAGAESSEPLQLFALVSQMREKLDRRRFSGRCYGFEAFQNGTPVRECVPAQKVSTGEVGLFDRVTGIFFAAQGGVFLAGPESRQGMAIIFR